jgi:hypothetical protein
MGGEFRVELDRLRLEFTELQEEHRVGHHDKASIERYLVHLQSWLAHVELFRRRFLMVEPSHDAPSAGRS